MRHSAGTPARGFTLIEMAIVLAIIATLSVAALAPFAVRQEARERRETADALDRALEALYGFALIHGRLPCPDDIANRDGREDRQDAHTCTNSHGLLPHVDLGVPGSDAWGGRLRYHATVALPGSTGSNFAAEDDGLCAADDQDLDLCERGGLAVFTRGDDPRTAAVETRAAYVLADGVPAVIIAHGRNGHGAWRGGARRSVPARHVDEGDNADADNRFMARDYALGSEQCNDLVAGSAPLCAFDDQLRWMSPNVLAARLVSGGRLP